MLVLHVEIHTVDCIACLTGWENKRNKRQEMAKWNKSPAIKAASRHAADSRVNYLMDFERRRDLWRLLTSFHSISLCTPDQDPLDSFITTRQLVADHRVIQITRVAVCSVNLTFAFGLGRVICHDPLQIFPFQRKREREREGGVASS